MLNDEYQCLTKMIRIEQHKGFPFPIKLDKRSPKDEDTLLYAAISLL